MYVEAARKYIPNEASMTDQQIDEVCPFPSVLTNASKCRTDNACIQLAAKWSPLGRVGEPEDVSRVVAFLCSQDGGWMNGQVLAIGGGAAM